MSSATAKNCLLGFSSFSSRCHRLLVGHTLPPLHQMKQAQIPQPVLVDHVVEALGHPGGHLLGVFLFLIICLDLESPEWNESFNAGPHMHQQRRKATSLDLLTTFLLMMFILLKLNTEDTYSALESSTGLVQPCL